MSSMQDPVDLRGSYKVLRGRLLMCWRNQPVYYCELKPASVSFPQMLALFFGCLPFFLSLCNIYVNQSCCTSSFVFLGSTQVAGSLHILLEKTGKN